MMAMKIQVSGLAQGSHHYSFRVQPAEIGLQDHYASELAVEVDLEKTPTQLALRAQLATEGRFTCDRCAEEFVQELAASYRMHYLWNQEEASQLDPSEVQIVAPNFAVIDLLEDVRQTLILAVPLKLLCRSDCKGLCPQCGKNLNEERCSCSSEPGDSRWEALRSLRSN
jgi:uncharacterized protein